MVEITNHSSTSAFKEWAAAVIEGGAVKFNCNFLPSSTTQGYATATTGLIYNFKNRTVKDFQITFPNTAATVWTFTAWISDMDIKAPVNGKLEGQFTLTVTGVPGFA